MNLSLSETSFNMSYNDLIQNEAIRTEFLVILKPSKRVTDWKNIVGYRYSSVFLYGYVVGVTINGEVQTLATSASPSVGEYFWDNETRTVYVIDSSITTSIVSVTYELYFATNGAHFPRIPTEEKSENNIDVYYEPVVIDVPAFKATLDQSIIGFLPSQTSRLTLGNYNSELEKYLYDSSFSKKQILVYHWLSKLKTENIKLLIDATMGNLTYTTSKLKIDIIDRIEIFSNEYRNENNSFYKTSDFPNLSEYYVGTPITYVIGKSESINFINLDYNVDTPTTSNNRVWSIREGNSSQTAYEVVFNTNTTTRTYPSFSGGYTLEGLNIGDHIQIAQGLNNYYAIITDVNRSGILYIDHTAIPVACTVGDTIYRSTCGNAFIIQNSKRYKLFRTRDYVESVINNVVVITLNSSAETNVGCSTLNGLEEIQGRVYGETNSVTKDGIAFGNNSEVFGSLTNPAVILFSLLKKSGVQENEINLSSFDDLNNEIGDIEIGFALPLNDTNSFPVFKEIFINIFKSNLIQLFLNTENKWTVNYLKPLSTPDVTVDNSDILEKSLTYSIDYDDLVSNVIVGYDYSKTSTRYKTQSYESNIAKFLHGINRQKTFNTFLLNKLDAYFLALQLSHIYGDRKGVISFRCKNRFFENFISDIIGVSLEKHVGFDYENGVSRERSYSIISIEKNSKDVTIIANDQKGVQENMGDF